MREYLHFLGRLALFFALGMALGAILAATNAFSSSQNKTMIASWYGPRFHGRPMANGSIFNQNAKTAAHKTLPFGTKLRVTHPETKKSVVVIITDRGPFIKGRELDLSAGAAKHIGFTGVGVVRVEIL